VSDPQRRHFAKLSLHRGRVTSFADKCHGSTFEGKPVRAYFISGFSPQRSIGISSDSAAPEHHTEASMARSIQKALGHDVASSLRFGSKYYATRCSVLFANVQSAILALVDIVSEGDRTRSLRLVRGERAQVSLGGVASKIQFLPPSSHASPRHSPSCTTHKRKAYKSHRTERKSARTDASLRTYRPRQPCHNV
jgi:hypothetical protein